MTDADYLVRELSDVESRHFWFQARRRLITDIVKTHFATATHAVDVGCGTGFVLEGLRAALPGCHFVGCDQHAPLLALARARGVPAVRAAADRLPFGARFDVALVLDVLEHIDDDVRALTAIRSVVGEGGGVVITVPQHRWLWSEVDVFSCHRRRYTRRALKSVVQAAGFRIERATSMFAATLPLMLLSRLRQRTTFEVKREFQIPALLNTALGLATEIEWTAIKAGVRLPVGGSLLMVARRS